MSSVRSVVSVTGFSDNGDPVTVQGEPTRTLHFNAGEFSVSSDTSVTPPRAKVSLKAAFVSVITALGETVAGLATSVTTLLEFKTNAEPYATAGGRWGIPETFVGATPPETIVASVGDYIRVDLDAYGASGVCTVELPEANEGRVGQRIRIAEITGNTIGPGNAELHVATTGGQTIDTPWTANPFEMTGVRPRATFVVVENAGPTYEWSLEAET
jgi:hypothetical protein